MVPKTRIFQVADGKDLVILACTIFDWSICVTDRQTDRQMDGRTNGRMDEQTELRWLRHAESSSCFHA